MSKLQPKEERILNILKSKKGQIIPSKAILLEVEDNPVKKAIFEECWQNEEIRKKYRGILKTWICQIQKKTGTEIENLRGIGYKLV